MYKAVVCVTNGARLLERTSTFAEEKETLKELMRSGIRLAANRSRMSCVEFNWIVVDEQGIKHVGKGTTTKTNQVRTSFPGF